VILLSAKAQEADVQAGRDTGAEDYVTKPFDPLELLKLLDDNPNLYVGVKPAVASKDPDLAWGRGGVLHRIGFKGSS